MIKDFCSAIAAASRLRNYVWRIWRLFFFGSRTLGLGCSSITGSLLVLRRLVAAVLLIDIYLKY